MMMMMCVCVCVCVCVFVAYRCLRRSSQLKWKRWWLITYFIGVARGVHAQGEKNGLIYRVKL